MNTLVKDGPGTAVATTRNPWTEAGSELAPSSIFGTLIRFSKGDFLAGKAPGTLVALGTKFVVIMDKVTWGFIRWENNRPTDNRMVLTMTTKKALRKDLGELDQTEWDTDDQGQPKDPWQETINMPMLNGKGEPFTFTTSSVGGRNACGKFFDAYGRALAAHEGEYPIVELGMDSYMHTIKSRGRVKFPTFKIVGWISDTKVAGSIANVPAHGVDEPEEHEDPGYGMDDEIPF